MPVAVVTGANRGIGLELTRQLIAGGWTVHGACRSASPGLEASGAQVHEDVEVSDDASVFALVSAVGAPVDLLVNNAGILSSETLDDLDFERIRRQMEVNAYGPLRVTAAFRPSLRKGSKVAIVTSRMGSVADNTSGSRYGYRMSKAAVNMAGVSLARDLEPAGIAVALLHPGFVQTKMTGGRGNVDPATAASGLLERIEELNLENTGTFWHAEGAVLPW